MLLSVPQTFNFSRLYLDFLFLFLFVLSSQKFAKNSLDVFFSLFISAVETVEAVIFGHVYTSRVANIFFFGLAYILFGIEIWHKEDLMFFTTSFSSFSLYSVCASISHTSSFLLLPSLLLSIYLDSLFLSIFFFHPYCLVLSVTFSQSSPGKAVSRESQTGAV